ncbi:hypothetical protein HC891_03435 [Candidatus Gracilibacteria bacterium]|nr:hypothetical protein [Candidatus Gracilibacteria bacterium]
MFATEQWPFDIHAKHTIDALIGSIKRIAAAADTGVIDQNVDTAEIGARLCHHRHNGLFARYIRGASNRPPARLVDARSKLARSVAVLIGQQHICALCCEQARRCCPNAGTRPGNNCTLARKSPYHDVILSLLQSATVLALDSGGFHPFDDIALRKDKDQQQRQYRDRRTHKQRR